MDRNQRRPGRRRSQEDGGVWWAPRPGPGITAHTHSHTHNTIIITIQLYVHHLLTGVARDILGSLILKFPREPAVYCHILVETPTEARRLVEEEGSQTKKTWLQKTRRAGELLFRALLPLLVKTVLSSLGLLTVLHQEQENWRKKSMKSARHCKPALKHMLLTL